MKWTAVLICASLLGSMPCPIAQEATPLEIQVVWSAAVPEGYDGAQHAVVDFARTPAAGLALYGQHKSTETKVQVLDHGRIDWVSVNPSAGTHHIAATSNGHFFLAGSIPQIHGWLSLEKSPSDAYLAHFSATGNLLWDRSFGDVGFQVATDVAPLPNGGALVALLDHRSIGLWAVGPNGETTWHQPIGVQDAAIAVTPTGSTIVAVTMDNAGRDSRAPDYTEDLVLSLRDLAGIERSRIVVRPDLNRSAGAHYLKVSVDVSDETILMASSWDYFSRNHDEHQPVEVAAYDHAGALKWRHRPAIDNCDTAPFFLPNGEAIIACAEPSHEAPRHLILNLYGLAGEVTELRAPLPECHQTRYPVAIHVVDVLDDIVTLLASRPPNNVGASCTWLGTIDLGRATPRNEGSLALEADPNDP